MREGERVGERERERERDEEEEKEGVIPLLSRLCAEDCSVNMLLFRTNDK